MLHITKTSCKALYYRYEIIELHTMHNEQLHDLYPNGL